MKHVWLFGDDKKRFTNCILVVKHEVTIEYLSNKLLLYSNIYCELNQ